METAITTMAPFEPLLDYAGIDHLSSAFESAQFADNRAVSQSHPQLQGYTVSTVPQVPLQALQSSLYQPRYAGDTYNGSARMPCCHGSAAHLRATQRAPGEQLVSDAALAAHLDRLLPAHKYPPRTAILSNTVPSSPHAFLQPSSGLMVASSQLAHEMRQLSRELSVPSRTLLTRSRSAAVLQNRRSDFDSIEDWTYSMPSTPPGTARPDLVVRCGFEQPGGRFAVGSASPAGSSEAANTQEASDRAEDDKDRRTSTNNDEKGYICSDCGRAFKANFNLKAHMETHNPNRVAPFHCKSEGCDRKFLRNADLVRHRGSVSCCVDIYRWRHSVLGVLTHVRQVHEDGGRFTCPMCRRHFGRKDTQRR